MMSPTKILFLDIDGVLNSKRTCEAFDGYPHNFADMKRFDSVAIALVQRLCAQTACAVVLSSDWRFDFTAQETAKALDLPVIDVTPKLVGSRGKEINAWLAAHPEVTVFAIVDDIAEMFDTHPIQFVHTDDKVGLSLTNYLDLRRILGGSLVWA